MDPNHVVLYTDTSGIYSGAEASLEQLLGALSPDYQPVVCFNYPQPHQKRYPTDMATYCWRADGLRWWMGSDRWQRPLRGTDFLKRLIFARRLQQHARQHNAAIVHVNLTWANSYIDLRAAKMAGIKTVAHVRSIAPWYRLPQRLMDQCDAMICVSETVKNDVLSWGRHDHVVRVYDPIDVSKYTPSVSKEAAKRTLGLPTDKTILSSVALLSEHKGHDIAIQAFGRLADDYPDLHLFVAGGPLPSQSTELDRLKQIAAEAGVSDRVTFTGEQIKNVDLAYQASDIVYALTKNGEAFGRVALEVGTSERVVVATRLGATVEIVRHEETGLLVAGEDVEDTAKWTRVALDNPDLRARIGQQAAAHVREHFSPEVHARQVEAVYEKILGRDQGKD